MSSINMRSILSKLNTHTSGESFKKQLDAKMDELILTGKSGNRVSTHTPHQAAEKFIEVLQGEIRGRAGEDFKAGDLGSTAISALENLSKGSIQKRSNGRYQIGIWFSGDLTRMSLAEDDYDKVNNIAALLNSGYDAGGVVYGIWLGHNNNQRRASLKHRSGSHFIEDAIRNYMENYAAEYGVIDIECADEYGVR